MHQVAIRRALTVNMLINPIQEAGHPGVHPGTVGIATAITLAPACESVQHPVVAFLAHQGAAGVTLQEASITSHPVSYLSNDSN